MHSLGVQTLFRLLNNIYMTNVQKFLLLFQIKFRSKKSTESVNYID